MDVLKKVYFFLIYGLTLIIVFTPYLIKDDLSIFSEEFLEGCIILILLAIGWVLNFFYEREIKQQEHVMEEAWKHIGAVNLLVERFRLALTDDKEYPRNKKELQLFAESALEKMRGVIHCEFMLLRVVDTESLNTVFEYGDVDAQENDAMPKIGNKELLNSQSADGFDTVCSQSNAVKLKTFVIFPKTQISEDGKIVTQKVVNDFTMVYIISTYIL
jgi:hypothetical protein